MVEAGGAATWGEAKNDAAGGGEVPRMALKGEGLYGGRRWQWCDG